jgi:flagellar hook-length control protein FliK
VLVPGEVSHASIAYGRVPTVTFADIFDLAAATGWPHGRLQPSPGGTPVDPGAFDEILRALEATSGQPPIDAGRPAGTHGFDARLPFGAPDNVPAADEESNPEDIGVIEQAPAILPLIAAPAPSILVTSDPDPADAEPRPMLFDANGPTAGTDQPGVRLVSNATENAEHQTTGLEWWANLDGTLAALDSRAPAQPTTPEAEASAGTPAAPAIGGEKSLDPTWDAVDRFVRELDTAIVQSPEGDQEVNQASTGTSGKGVAGQTDASGSRPRAADPLTMEQHQTGPGRLSPESARSPKTLFGRGDRPAHVVPPAAPQLVESAPFGLPPESAEARSAVAQPPENGVPAIAERDAGRPVRLPQAADVPEAGSGPAVAPRGSAAVVPIPATQDLPSAVRVDSGASLPLREQASSSEPATPPAGSAPPMPDTVFIAPPALVGETPVIWLEPDGSVYAAARGSIRPPSQDGSHQPAIEHAQLWRGTLNALAHESAEGAPSSLSPFEAASLAVDRGSDGVAQAPTVPAREPSHVERAGLGSLSHARLAARQLLELAMTQGDTGDVANRTESAPVRTPTAESGAAAADAPQAVTNEPANANEHRPVDGRVSRAEAIVSAMSQRGSAAADGDRGSGRAPREQVSGPQLVFNATSAFGIPVEFASTISQGLAPEQDPSAASDVRDAAWDGEAPSTVGPVRLRWQDGIGEARLRLGPDHLGDVSVSVRVEHHTVTAALRAATVEQQQWIAAHESELRHALGEQGLELDRLEVSVDPDREQRQTPRQEPPIPFRMRRNEPDADGQTFEVNA